MESEVKVKIKVLGIIEVYLYQKKDTDPSLNSNWREEN